MAVKETVTEFVKQSVISSGVWQFVFSLVIRNGKIFLSVSFDYVFSEPLVFTIVLQAVFVFRKMNFFLLPSLSTGFPVFLGSHYDPIRIPSPGFPVFLGSDQGPGFHFSSFSLVLCSGFPVFLGSHQSPTKVLGPDFQVCRLFCGIISLHSAGVKPLFNLNI